MKKLLCLALTVVMVVFCASFLNFSVCAAGTNIVKYDFESFNAGGLSLDGNYTYDDGVMYFKINNPAVDQGQGVGISVENDAVKGKVLRFKGNATNHSVSFKLNSKLKTAYDSMNLSTIKVTVSFDYKGLISPGTNKALGEVKLFETLGRTSTDLESTHTSKKNWRIGYLEKTVNVWHHFEGSFLLSAQDYAMLTAATPDLYRVQFDKMNSTGGEFYIDNFVVTASDPSATPVPTVAPTPTATVKPATPTPTANPDGNAGSNDGGDSGSAVVQPTPNNTDVQTGVDVTPAPDGTTPAPDGTTPAPDGTQQPSGEDTTAPGDNAQPTATSAPGGEQTNNIVLPIVIGAVVLGGAVAGFVIYKKKKQN